MWTGLLSKHSIYTKQSHIHMIHSTVQHPSSWTLMAEMLTFHDHPFYNQFCWPVVPGSDNNHNATAGLWVSFPHYPATAQITLSTVLRLLVQCCTGTVTCLTAILVCEIWVKVILAPTAASYLVGPSRRLILQKDTDIGTGVMVPAIHRHWESSVMLLISSSV